MPRDTRHTTCDRPCRRPRQGFTLIEMLVVVVIMGILAGVGIVRISKTSVFMAESERVARRLVADLRVAHSSAIATGKNHYLSFTQSGGRLSGYAAYRVETGGDVQVEAHRTVPGGVALVGSAARAEFTPMGDALAAYSYTVTCPGWEYTVTVTLATGAVAIDKQAN